MKDKGKEYVWLYVTDDEYEFPLIMAESVKELAQIVGTSPNTISSSFIHWKEGRNKKCRYRKVRVK